MQGTYDYQSFGNIAPFPPSMAPRQVEQALVNNYDSETRYQYIHIKIPMNQEDKEIYTYEVQNFIEENLRSTVNEITTFRNQQNKITGEFIIQFQGPIGKRALQKLQNQRFKDRNFELRVFETDSSVRKFLCYNALSTLNEVQSFYGDFPQTSQVITMSVYVKGFLGNRIECENYFHQFGDFSHIKECFPYNGDHQDMSKPRLYYIVYYRNESACHLAVSCTNGFRYIYPDGKISEETMISKILYKRSVEVTFCIQNYSGETDSLIDLLQQYGVISKLGVLHGGKEVYVKMNKEGAMASVMFLDGAIINESEIRAYFIDTTYFNNQFQTCKIILNN